MYSRVPGRVQADLKAEQGGAPVWVCEVHWDSPVQGGRWGSPHTIDIPLVFDNVDLAPTTVGPRTEAVQKVADAMSESRLALAHTGNPNNAFIPAWEPYNLADRATMLFDEQSRAVDDPHAEERILMSRYESQQMAGGRALHRTERR